VIRIISIHRKNVIDTAMASDGGVGRADNSSAEARPSGRRTACTEPATGRGRHRCGRPAQGVHAVALREGSYLDKFASREALDLAAWCTQVGARLSPSTPLSLEPHRSGQARRARSGRRGHPRLRHPSLEARKVAPSIVDAQWRRTVRRDRAALSRCSTGQCRLRPVCCETFPRRWPVPCREGVSARRKATVRRNCSVRLGLHQVSQQHRPGRRCALRPGGPALLAGRFKAYATPGGFIVVPA